MEGEESVALLRSTRVRHFLGKENDAAMLGAEILKH
jgi:hypothetical protein